MTASEKIAYLKGLADGLGLGRETKEEKLIAAIIDTLDSLALDLTELQESYDELSEELDAVSDDLALVEDAVYGDDYDDDYDDDECCCHDDEEEPHEHEDGCGCGGQGEHHGHGHHHHGGHCCHGRHHGVMYEITCPSCDNTITIDEEVLNLGSIQCPNCGGILEFDVEGSEIEGN